VYREPNKKAVKKGARASPGSTSSMALEEIQRGRESSNFGQNAGLKQI